MDAPSFLDREYDYSVPPELAAKALPGAFVTVPFGGGNRRHMALVTSTGPRDAFIKRAHLRIEAKKASSAR